MPAGYRIPIQSSNMYYPYGFLQPGRYSQTAVTSRYGFNGMEKDNELKGEGNSLDFGARMYDSRWLSLDPLMRKYSFVSPYNFALNNPVYFIDPDGREIIVHSESDKKVIVAALKKITAGNVEIEAKPQMDGTYKIYAKPIANVEISEESKTIINLAENSYFKHIIRVKNENATIVTEEFSGKRSGSNILFDPSYDGGSIENVDGTTGRPAESELYHELLHAQEIQEGEDIDSKSDTYYFTRAEQLSIIDNWDEKKQG